MQPTHINAYVLELQEAEKEAARASAKVESLRETIATMRQSEAEAAGVTPETDQTVQLEAAPAEAATPAVEASEAEPADSTPSEETATDETVGKPGAPAE